MNSSSRNMLTRVLLLVEIMDFRNNMILEDARALQGALRDVYVDLGSGSQVCVRTSVPNEQHKHQESFKALLTEVCTCSVGHDENPEKLSLQLMRIGMPSARCHQGS